MIPYFSFDSPFDSVPNGGFFVRPGPALPADEELMLRIADCLRGDLEGPGNRVVLEVQNGVVVLEGVVVTRALNALMHRLVWRVPGVADVCNRLTTWEDERRGHVDP
ncbi:BON domain-containing protein [Actinoplanes auranticolor]|uniref:BON domain-containing protein n=1 Tax=Actinoplanes auranticolor TaxID=47988 RepID=A0A919SJA1_9ACTN|nr:BON domain-containing protein [Actinoplanes auranticolor]GIM71993.1 hypothetical protein Aau02nite_48740 [Actinoplanes auranticolor]